MRPKRLVKTFMTRDATGRQELIAQSVNCGSPEAITLWLFTRVRLETISHFAFPFGKAQPGALEIHPWIVPVVPRIRYLCSTIMTWPMSTYLLFFITRCSSPKTNNRERRSLIGKANADHTSWFNGSVNKNFYYFVNAKHSSKWIQVIHNADCGQSTTSDL